MTSVAIWFNNEDGASTVWAVADTLLSERHSQGSSMLANAGGKVFSIPVVLRKIKPLPHGRIRQTERCVSKIGLAFAGSSLVGLNVYAALTTILASLFDSEDPPSLRSIAEYAAMLATSYIGTLAVVKSDGALCELAITGYCPIQGDFEIHHLIPDPSDGTPKARVESYQLKASCDEFVLLLGGYKREIANEIEKLRSELPHKTRSWYRAPKSVLRRIIDSNRFPTIGGHMQLGIGDSVLGFEHWFPHETSIDDKGSRATISYLGFDVLGDASHVGSCRVNFKAMADVN